MIAFRLDASAAALSMMLSGSAGLAADQNAHLPDDRVQNTLEGMRPGEVRWTTPWAMGAAADGSLCLIPDYPAELKPNGKLHMRVERGLDGLYRVDISNDPGYRWVKDPQRPICDGIPVTEAKFE
jgi:hypothetical protein